MERKKEKERGRWGRMERGKKVENAHLLEKKLFSSLKCRSLILSNRKQISYIKKILT